MVLYHWLWVPGTHIPRFARQAKVLRGAIVLMWGGVVLGVIVGDWACLYFGCAAETGFQGTACFCNSILRSRLESDTTGRITG